MFKKNWKTWKNTWFWVQKPIKKLEQKQIKKLENLEKHMVLDAKTNKKARKPRKTHGFVCK